VALVFSLQGVAFVFVNIVGLALATITVSLLLHNGWVSSDMCVVLTPRPLAMLHLQTANVAIYRIILGLGAVPGLVILGLTCQSHRQETGVSRLQTPLSPTRHSAKDARQHVVE
jgi:hypothetical protein